MRGATFALGLQDKELAVSIHAPHAGRDAAAVDGFPESVVSIHAPHAGRDAALFRRICVAEVSIHAPHAGRDVVWDFFPYFRR